MRRCSLLAALQLVVLLVAPVVGRAHPLAPCLLELREAKDDSYEVTWKMPRFRAPGAQLAPILPPHCRSGSAKIDVDDISVRSQWTADCGGQGLVGAGIQVGGMQLASDAALVRVVLRDGRTLQGIVSARQPTFVVAPRPNRLDVIADYFLLGTRHILTGIDHLLFVFGLLLLVFASTPAATGVAAPRAASTARALFSTITAFTLGHCMTLSLAALDVIHPPSAFIEVGIALSVFALAVELTRTRASTLMRRFPWLMALLFGLLHGLGFAAALREAGLPTGEVPLALASFNVGIESGQLLFVSIVLALHYGIQRARLQLPPWVAPVPVYLMGSLAAFWSFERVAALLH